MLGATGQDAGDRPLFGTVAGRRGYRCADHAKLSSRAIILRGIPWRGKTSVPRTARAVALASASTRGRGDQAIHPASPGQVGPDGSDRRWHTCVQPGRRGQTERWSQGKDGSRQPGLKNRDPGILSPSKMMPAWAVTPSKGAKDRGPGRPHSPCGILGSGLGGLGRGLGGRLRGRKRLLQPLIFFLGHLAALGDLVGAVPGLGMGLGVEFA